MACFVTCLRNAKHSSWPWMVNRFVLWSMRIVIFILGCVTVSNVIIPQMADGPLPPVLQLVLHWEKEFLPLIALLNNRERFLDFYIHCRMKKTEDPVSRTLISRDFPEHNGGHGPGKREELHLAGYCLSVTLGVLRRQKAWRKMNHPEGWLQL